MYPEFETKGMFEGQLLVATQLLRGSCFEKSVIYICSHNETGAMGLLINHTLADVRCSDVLEQLFIKPSQIESNLPIHFGGPVSSSKGFILHTNDYTSNDTQALSNNICLTSTVDILKDIASGKGPRKSIVAFGYSGWGAGQLESEIKENSWITVPATEELIFDTSNPAKWEAAAETLGINLMQYSALAGRA